MGRYWLFSQGFYLGTFEITQAQWEAVMGTKPWQGELNVQDKPDHPAVYISWDDIHGNVYEWVADAYGDYSSGAVTDPSGPASGTGYVGRGGSFSNAARRLRSANRLGSIPRRYGNMGARLLRTGPQLSGTSAVSGRSWGQVKQDGR